MRLDKFLVDCGVGSRTEVKQLLKQKKIAVNGKKETAGKLQIDPAKDQVTFMGENLVHETFVYYLLHWFRMSDADLSDRYAWKYNIPQNRN